MCRFIQRKVEGEGGGGRGGGWGRWRWRARTARRLVPPAGELRGAALGVRMSPHKVPGYPRALAANVKRCSRKWRQGWGMGWLCWPVCPLCGRPRDGVDGFGRVGKVDGPRSDNHSPPSPPTIDPSRTHCTSSATMASTRMSMRSARASHPFSLRSRQALRVCASADGPSTSGSGTAVAVNKDKLWKELEESYETLKRTPPSMVSGPVPQGGRCRPIMVPIRASGGPLRPGTARTANGAALAPDWSACTSSKVT